MANGVQSFVQVQPAVGVAGDFATANPRFTQLAGPSAIVAGASGLTVGRFAWLSYSRVDGDNAPAVANNFGSGPVAGFVGRTQQGLITTYLSSAGMTIPAGFQATLFSGGDFWVVNSGAAAVYPGMKAYADFTTGAATFAAAGAPTVATTAGTATIAAGTAATGTGTIVNNVLTISGVTNTIYPGALITGTGVATGTSVVSQISGTPGGAGTYAVDLPGQTVTSTALTLTPYVLTTGAVVGTIVIGSVIRSAAGTVTGTVVGAPVTAQITSTTYVVDTNGGTVTAGAVVLASNVETSWYAKSQAAIGELVKISNVPGLG